LGGSWFQASLGKKKFTRSHLNRKMLSMVVYACHPSYSEIHKSEGCGPCQPGQKVRSYLQNNQSKRGWRRGSSSRLLLSSNRSTAKKRKKNPIPLSSHSFSWALPPLPPTAEPAVHLLSIFIDLTFLDISCEWDNTVCVLSWRILSVTL
jgi:hypothetical protein